MFKNSVRNWPNLESARAIKAAININERKGIEIEKEKNTDEIIEIGIKIYCLTVGTYLIVNLWKARQSIPAAP
jgi:hypothetical protein